MIAVSRAAAGDRQQQEEEGDAGDRVEDAGRAGSGGTAASGGGGRAGPARRRSRSRSRPRSATSSRCWSVGVRSGRCCPSPSRSRRACPCAWQGRVSERVPDCRLRPPARRAGRASDCRGHSPSGRSAAPCSSVFASRRAEELGDDLDREHAGDPAVAVGHRRVLRLALEQVGERVAHHVVEVEHRPGRESGRRGRSRRRGRARRASRAGGARRRPAAGCGTSASSSFARTSAVGWPT